MGWFELLFSKKQKSEQGFDAVLYRAVENEHGTFGVLIYKDQPLCVTVEPEWRDNQNNISCIPEGIYQVSPHNGGKYKNVWKLHDVPNRAAILIHAGNTEDNTEGCIIVGSSFGNLNGKYAVLRSGEALEKLRAILPSKFTLKVTSVY